MKLKSVLGVIIGVGLASSATAAIELSGYFITGEEARFSLQDTTQKESSRWLALGQSFRGYKLTAFDAATETLSITGAEGTQKLRVRPSVTKDAKMTISGSIGIGVGESIEVKKAHLVLGEETAFPLKNEITLYLKPARLPDGTMKYQSRFEQALPDGTRKVLSAPNVLALANAEFSVQAGDFGYSFKP